MNKPIDVRHKRSAFVLRCINDLKKGAKELSKMAKSMEECRTSSDVIHALSQILHLSYKTIERDVLNRHYDLTVFLLGLFILV